MTTAKTSLYDLHARDGAKLVEFAGWWLPMHYADGLIAEHLACRKHGGIFDISHMGRFLVNGPEAVAFLESVLTNRASKLKPGQAQYTIISNQQGCPLDDAYLYCLEDERYMLVVNAGNKETAWGWLSQHNQTGAEFSDASERLAMLAVQGPQSEQLLASLLDDPLPGPSRNQGAWNIFNNTRLFVSRTGYTGEPLSFEIFLAWDEAPKLWEALTKAGAGLGVVPVGLGARDTLRLEAGLPLFGREYDAGRPIMAVPTAKYGVDLGPKRGDFIGQDALARQAQALAVGDGQVLPQKIYAVAGLAKGMMREGSVVRGPNGELGTLTSATAIPAWRFKDNLPGDEHYNRLLGLALLDSKVRVGQELEITYRKQVLPGRVVRSFSKPVGGYLKPIEF